MDLSSVQQKGRDKDKGKERKGKKAANGMGRSELLRMGLCFKCGQAGHLMSKCPSKGAATSKGGGGSAKVAELEAAVSAKWEELNRAKELEEEEKAKSSKNGGAQE